VTACCLGVNTNLSGLDCTDCETRAGCVGVLKNVAGVTFSEAVLKPKDTVGVGRSRSVNTAGMSGRFCVVLEANVGLEATTREAGVGREISTASVATEDPMLEMAVETSTLGASVTGEAEVGCTSSWVGSRLT